MRTVPQVLSIHKLFISIIGLFGLLVVGPQSHGQAQDAFGPASLARAEARRTPSLSRIAADAVGRRALIEEARAQAQSLDPALEKYPVVLLPAGKGFSGLQEALAFCGPGRANRAITILLEPTTYTGNFTLPPLGVTIVVGRAGKHATIIQGGAAVNQPTVTYAPVSGPTSSQLIIHGLTIRGPQQAAVSFSSSGAHAELWFDDCIVETTSAIPAIHMTGTGLGPDNRALLELTDTDVSSMGDGISTSVGSFADVLCIMSVIEAADTAILAQATPGSTHTEVILAFGAADGQTALQATEIVHVSTVISYLSADGTVVDLTSCPDASLEMGELHSRTGDAVHLDQTDLRLDYARLSPDSMTGYGIRVENSSVARVAYCGFNTNVPANAMFVDGTSTSTTIYNHTNYSPGP